MHNVIFLVFIFSISLSQNSFNQHGNREGEWFGYHDNGILKYEGVFADGRELGFFKYYDYSGNLAVILHYIDSGVKSQAILYYPNGSIKSKGEYVNKKKNNIWLHYNHLGQKMSQESYLNGVLNGEATYYYSNGVISENYVYLNGVKHGLANVFYPSGLLNMTSNYFNGKLHGDTEFYYNNKIIQLESQGQYNSGLKDSIWIFYDTLGNVIKREQYENDIILNDE